MLYYVMKFQDSGQWNRYTLYHVVDTLPIDIGPVINRDYLNQNNDYTMDK